MRQISISRRPLLLFMSALLLMATAVAWSSSRASASTRPSHSLASAAKVARDLTAARSQIAEFTKVPAFTAPGPKIDVKSLKGETVYSIPQSSSIPFLATTEQAEESIAKKAGIHFVEYPNQGTTQEWIRGINQAIAAHAKAIILNALDPRLVAPQVAAAKKAGIKVISAQFFDLSQLSQAPKTLAGVRADNFTQAAKLEADYVISQTDGKADAVVVENKEQLSTVAMITAMKAQFKAYCPDCKVTYLNVPATQWATQIQPQVASALAADPSINYVIPIYDPMSQFVIPAITSAGDTSKVGIATFNGTPFALKDLADKDVIKMDISENLAWIAAANMDEAFRAMLGVPTLANEHTAMRVFTSANIAQTGNPPSYDLGLGSAWKTGYAKIWGITP
jgi:ribose transport system substrate-binding protein